MTSPAMMIPAVQRALVVDDDTSVRRILCRVLERSGWEVEEAEDARTAARLLGSARASRYTMVLCDLNLPDGSGLELRRRTVGHTPELAGRFVLMTGEAAIDVDLTDGDDVELLGKPFTLDQLMALQERMTA